MSLSVTIDKLRTGKGFSCQKFQKRENNYCYYYRADKPKPGMSLVGYGTSTLAILSMG